MLYVYDHLDAAGAINTALVQNGLVVENLHVTAADLEDYFIHAVGGNQHV